jgi:hypothetical protein
VKRYLVRLLVVVVALAAQRALTAQFQMPDAKQMSGIPRPVTDLPDRTVSVRLIRGDLSHNLTDFQVELHVGVEVRTVKTNEAGRAEFGDLPAGATLRAVAVVDGERLESEEFPAPAQGGIRLMLVATDKSKAAATTPDAPSVTGQVVIGGQSRIVAEPGEDGVALFYLLDIQNSARTPVTPPTPFTFDMPEAAVRTSVLEGSSPQASVSGRRVQVKGPFAPGRTLVQVASEVPISSGSLELTQVFPATFEQLGIIVKKTGDMKLASAQISRQQDMAASGETFIAAAGGAVSAGQPIVFTLDNLPHHSAAPRWIALSLAGAVLLAGAWLTQRPAAADAKSDERKRLISRREKLFADLVRLEHERRDGKVSESRYLARREELVTALERIYGALEGDDMTPEPSDRSGLAA